MLGDNNNNPKTSKNPAFAALGLPKFKLPSKPWMVFWTVTAALAGGILFDKYEQKQLRYKYQEWGLKNYGNKEMKAYEMPRKVRVYVAPFPNDYLNESLKYLKRFVKPILNSSGIDLQIITMERQGDIRYKVAEEIRSMRRSKLGLPDVQKNQNADKDEEVKEKELNPLFSSIVKDRMTNTEEKADDNDAPENKIVSRHDLYTPMDVVSIKTLFNNENKEEKKLVYHDGLVDDVRDAGGVICIGRGAFKEYINGVHEGLLGPLYAPESGLEGELSSEKELNNTIRINEIDTPNADNIEEDNKGEAEAEKKNDKDKEDLAPAPYVRTNEYSKCDLAPELPELYNLQECRDSNGVPYFFVQPVLELRNYSVAGFSRQLERAWRFYNKRDQLIEYNEEIKSLLNCNWRSLNDQRGVGLDIGVQEEEDWPSKWRKNAMEKNSEWVREFNGDSRVLELLSTYNK